MISSIMNHLTKSPNKCHCGKEFKKLHGLHVHQAIAGHKTPVAVNPDAVTAGKPAVLVISLREGIEALKLKRDNLNEIIDILEAMDN